MDPFRALSFRPSRTFLGLLAGLLILCSGLEYASADGRRLVVRRFSGRGAGGFYGDVILVLENRHNLIANDRYVSNARKLGATRDSPDNIARVARKIGADGVIHGTVTRRGNGYRLVMKVHSAADGRVVREVVVLSPSPKLSRGMRSRMKRDLMDAIELLPTGNAGSFTNPDDEDEDDEDEDEDEEDDEEDDEDDDVRSDRRDRRSQNDVDDEDEDEDEFEEGFADEDDEGDKDEDDEDDEDEDDEDEDEGGDDGDDGDDEDDDDRPRLSDDEQLEYETRGRALELSAGLSFTARSLSFSVAPGATPPQGYTGSLPLPGVFIMGDVYPLAFNKANRSKLRNLGITGHYDQVLSVSASIPNGTMVTEVEGSQLRYGIGAVYRYNLGTSPDRPAFKFSLRYNKMRFALDKLNAGVAVPIPNVEYTYVDPAAAVRYPISPKLAFVGELHGLIFLDAGEIVTPEQYGNGRVLGLEGDVNLAYRLRPNWLLRFGARFMYIDYAFSGNGATIAAGAVDLYYGGYAVGAYQF